MRFIALFLKAYATFFSLAFGGMFVIMAVVNSTVEKAPEPLTLAGQITFITFGAAAVIGSIIRIYEEGIFGD